MKIQIASDLHLEMRPDYEPNPVTEFRPVPDRDVLVLAGDIGTHTNALQFVEDEARISPVILIPGNHEYYSVHTRHETDYAWRQIVESMPSLHYLVAEGVTIDGVRFWGAPWYSDPLRLRGPGSLRLIAGSLNDFDPKYDDSGRWTVQRHLEEHALQTRLLREQAGWVDVVITHWPPTLHAVAPGFKDDALTGYFVNDNEELVREIGAQAWISGHVHDAYEAIVGDTQVVSNPTSYPMGAADENGLFRPDRVIEIRPRRAARS
ncbi:MAG: hypothetical protein F4222_12705 [Gammaproteobacteria bacterium]|nr:hypothetical protein [Gammaproteobacteria bacterium]MYF59905.1 hypothetical protein [Gammaproteobacteria bacterium]